MENPINGTQIGYDGYEKVKISAFYLAGPARQLIHMIQKKRNIPWFSVLNILLVLIAIPQVNPWIRKNGDSTSAMLLGIGATLVVIFLIDLILLIILKNTRRELKD